MHPRIPRQSADEQGDRRPDGDAGLLSAELATVVAGARRRAVRDGDRQIDTAHLLHSLLEADPGVRAVFVGPQVARLLGYLVQRSIGYGLRWQSAVEDFGAGPTATGPLVSGRLVTGPAGDRPAVTDADGFSPLAAAALECARARAGRRGDVLARGVDLLAGSVAHPRARAVEVLRRAGIDAEDLALRLENELGNKLDGELGDDLGTGLANDAEGRVGECAGGGGTGRVGECAGGGGTGP
ncbi:Clp protease N-terminal domain-containing protein [Streptomyces sp. NPDC096152]|uniref:Clp protease N-terminal domain-containing protein n=1 Tax=Streptomyces sp. NPDC096152 TaxID=3366078 RepID=UPI00381B858A